MEDRTLTLAQLVRSKARHVIRGAEALRRLAAELERELRGSETACKEETDGKHAPEERLAGHADPR